MPTEPACICPAINVTRLGATKPETIPGWNPACTIHPVLRADAEEAPGRIIRFDGRLSEEGVANFRERWIAAHQDGRTQPHKILKPTFAERYATYMHTHQRRTRVARILRVILIGSLITLAAIVAVVLIGATR